MNNMKLNKKIITLTMGGIAIVLLLVILSTIGSVNLSLGEMADSYGVSRNAIHKQLKITTDKLQYYEDNLKLKEKNEKLSKLVEEISDEKIKNAILELI